MEVFSWLSGDFVDVDELRIQHHLWHHQRELATLCHLHILWLNDNLKISYKFVGP